MMTTTLLVVLTGALSAPADQPVPPAKPGRVPAPAPAKAGPDLLSGFERKVTAHTLKNGWRFLIVEEHQAPVV